MRIARQTQSALKVRSWRATEARSERSVMLPSGGQRASSSTSDAETARIECDVNAAEEMELERLEGSGSEGKNETQRQKKRRELFSRTL